MYDMSIDHILSIRSEYFIDYGQRDVTGKRISYHAIPIFHSMGIIMMGWTVRMQI